MDGHEKYPQNIQKLDHDLVLKAMMTWGSLISTQISEILWDLGTRFEDAPLLVVEKIETTAVPRNMLWRRDKHGPPFLASHHQAWESRYNEYWWVTSVLSDLSNNKRGRNRPNCNGEYGGVKPWHCHILNSGFTKKVRYHSSQLFCWKFHGQTMI